MIWARNRKAIDDGILMSQTGPVHREVGEHKTACGNQIGLRSIPVSDAQIEGFDLPICAQCYPDGHGRGGFLVTPAGRHRPKKGGTR